MSSFPLTNGWSCSAISSAPQTSGGRTTMALDFVAIDFEKANHNPESACAVGIARVRAGRLVQTTYRLIRPPTWYFVRRFTELHRISWDDVRHEPTFDELWRDLRSEIGRSVIVAHSASFDQRVFYSSLRYYGLPRLRNPFVCTVRLAREVLGLYPTNLPRVCRALRIPLRHHHAGSDAAAAARIALTAARSIGVATAETLARRYGE